MKNAGTIFLCLAAALALWAMSFSAGQHYVIEKSEMYIVEYDDDTAGENYDTVVYIEVPNVFDPDYTDVYSHGMYIG